MPYASQAKYLKLIKTHSCNITMKYIPILQESVYLILFLLGILFSCTFKYSR